jgi:thiol-disulfide isomerase/thioredoxin
MWIPVLAAVVFVVVFIGWYRYMRGFYPGSTIVEYSPQADPAIPSSDPDTPRLLMFYTTWCPHSRKALPEWQSLKTVVRQQKTKFGGKTLQFEAYDGDSDKTEVARYGIDAYPAIVLVTSSGIHHYDAAFKTARIQRWLVDTLGPEGT